MMNGQFEGFPPGFELEGGEDFHKKMMFEAGDEDDSEGDDFEEDGQQYEEEEEKQQAISSIDPKSLKPSTRLYDNLPTRFPNEELLEKLSNKLAEEE